MRRFVALTMVALLAWTAALAPEAALAAGGAASAAGGATSGLPGGTNPFSPGVPINPSPAPTTATPPIAVPSTTSSSSGGGLSGADAILIAIGALIVLGGISYFIWRDARRHAPVRHATHGGDLGGSRTAGSKRPVKARKLSPAERKRRKRGRAR